MCATVGTLLQTGSNPEEFRPDPREQRADWGTWDRGRGSATKKGAAQRQPQLGDTRRARAGGAVPVPARRR